MALIYASMVNYRCLQIVFQHGLLKNSTTGPQNISLKQNKSFKGGLPYPLSRKMAAEFVVSTAVTMCPGKLNCWPISSVYRFNLKVPARPINAKHTLRLLLRVKISANKIIY